MSCECEDCKSAVEQETLITGNVTITEPKMRIIETEDGDIKYGKFQNRPVEFRIKTKSIFNGPVEFNDTVTIPVDKIIYKFGNSGPLDFKLSPDISVTENSVSYIGPHLSNIDSSMFKFNEHRYIEDVAGYIEGTYTKHYSGKYQATDMIIDAGHGTGFNIGNIMKYAKRYGKKGGYNKDDLMKIIHYAIIQLHVHDTEGLEDVKE